MTEKCYIFAENVITMSATQKTLTAFRIEPKVLERIKDRSKSLNISVNKYVTDLIVKDLNENAILPKATVSAESKSLAKKYSGIVTIPSNEELEKDDRLRAIWER